MARRVVIPGFRKIETGGGGVISKNVIISTTPIEGGNRVTFSYTLDDGTVKTSTMDVMDDKDGIDGTNGKDGKDGLNGKDGEKGADGTDGYSPTVVENANNTEDDYKLDITDANGTFTTPNLMGRQGIQGIQGERCEQGETGLQGQQGIQGVKGEKGDDGYPFLIYKQYEVGIEEFNEADFPEIGLMFMIHVFEEGKGYPVYRYTADGTDTPYSLVTYMNTEGIKGEKGDKGEAGAQGIAGLDGKGGADGTTYTPSIGEVTTVDSNELASASVSVNTETKEAVFNFAIPRGNKGIDGVQISDNETVEDKTWSSSKIESEIPTTLPANGGNADTVNNHTVKSDVPENAKFTDTIYDDTEVKGSIAEINSNLNNVFKRPPDSWWVCDGDVNNILDTGIGLTTNQYTNLPDDGWGTLLSFVFDVSHRIQIVHTWNYSKIYVRACYGENWTDWKELTTMNKVANSIIRESRSVLYNLNNVDNIEVAIDIAKSGYKPIAVSLYNSGTHLWFAQGIYFNDTVCNLSLRGVTPTSATNAECKVLVTYIKTS